MLFDDWMKHAIARAGWSDDELGRRAGLPADRVRAWRFGLASRDAGRAIAEAIALRGASAHGDPPAWFNEALRRKDDMSLKELAGHLGVSVSDLTTELRRRGVRRKVKAAETAPSTDASPPVRRAGSKDLQIEQYYHLLGKVPDSEVARMSGVSVRTIASYRSRHEIEGYTGPRRRPAPRGHRESKVDDYAELLGKVPDRVIADIAGMSLGAVRNYRVKNNLPAAGRMPASEVDRIVTAWRRSKGLLPEHAAPPGPAGSRLPDGTQAWRCRVVGEERAFVVLATSLPDACLRAAQAAGGEDRVASIECLGEVVDPRG